MFLRVESGRAKKCFKISWPATSRVGRFLTPFQLLNYPSLTSSVLSLCRSVLNFTAVDPTREKQSDP